MKFYDALQFNPTDLKNAIRNAETKKEKNKLIVAIFVRAILIVLFSIVFIGFLGTFFNNANNPMAVVLFCILLGIRFVDFGYRVSESIFNMFLIFLLLLCSPVLASLVNPTLAFFIHFASFFTIILVGMGDPKMGNAGLYGFCYIYLAGNPVTGKLFLQRALLTLVGFIFCAIVFYVKHKDKFKDVSFYKYSRQFDLHNEASRMMLRLTLGVALVLSLGEVFGIERFMWMGFATSALLSTYPYNAHIVKRIVERVIGIVAGSLIFLAIYKIVPETYHFVLGPLGGFLIGFCSEYHFKTIVNCFGALLIAAGTYGIGNAVALRIGDNLIGVVLGVFIIWIFDIVIDKYYNRKNEEREAQKNRIAY